MACIVDQSGELLACEARRDIERGPGGAGGGEAALARDIAWSQRWTTMDEDVAWTAVAGDASRAVTATKATPFRSQRRGENVRGLKSITPD